MKPASMNPKVGTFFVCLLMLCSFPIKESHAHGTGHVVHLDCRRAAKGYKHWLFYRSDSIPSKIGIRAGKKVTSIEIYDDEEKLLYAGPPIKSFAVNRTKVQNLLVIPKGKGSIDVFWD